MTSQLSSATVALVVAISSFSLISTTAGGERPDGRCGPKYDCTPCREGQCCGNGDYCGSGSGYCGALTCSYQCPHGHGSHCEVPCGNNVTHGLLQEGSSTSTTGLEKPPGVRCETNRANVSMSWFREHGRRVFCDLPGATCGECLKVTNAKSGAHTTVRLANGDCSDEDLNGMAQQVFDELDGDDHGENDEEDVEQYLKVDYQVVHCTSN